MPTPADSCSPGGFWIASKHDDEQAACVTVDESRSTRTLVEAQQRARAKYLHKHPNHNLISREVSDRLLTCTGSKLAPPVLMSFSGIALFPI